MKQAGLSRLKTPTQKTKIKHILVIDAPNILKIGNSNISIQQPSKSKSQMEIEELKGLVIW